MGIQANVEGLGTLNFPDGTSPDVIQKTIKAQIAQQQQPQQKPGSQEQPQLGRIASEVVRPIAQGLTALPLMAADAGVAGGNLINQGIASLGGKSYPQEQLQLPSKTFEDVLNRVTTKPDTMLGRGIEDIESMLVGGPASVEEKAVTAARRSSSLSPKLDLLKVANEHGFTIPPSETGAKGGKFVQSIAGKPGVEEDASIKNAKRAEELVKDEIKVPQTSALDETTFKAKYADENAKFEAMRTLPGRLDSSDAQAHQQFLNAIVAAGDRFRPLADEFKDPKFGAAVTPDIEKQMSITMQDTLSPGAAMDRYKQLRDLRNQHMRSGEADDLIRAKVEGDLMTALEERLQAFADRSGKPEIAKAYREARTNLAKLNAVHDSMVGARLSVRALAKSKAPLTGNLKTVADLSQQFPKAFQDIQKSGERGPFSVVDMWILMSQLARGGGAAGAAAGVATHHYYSAAGSAALAAGTLARPVARAALSTKPYQRGMTRRLTTPAPPLSPFRAAAGVRAAQDVAQSAAGDVDQSTAQDVP